MRAYIAFTKKEFMEFTRTYKLLIMGAVFLVLGMMNPITAKITPMLLKTLMPEGMEISIGEPTALDSWAQFYKNIPQMGLIVLAIVFSGILSGEFSRGTLVNMLTKGLPRQTVILAKFTMAASIWTGAYVLCFGVTYAYTVYFWSGDGLSHLVFAALCLWLFGLFLLAAILLGGVLVKSNYGCLLFTGAVVVVLFLLDIVPSIAKVSPLFLASSNLALLSGQTAVSDFAVPMLVAVGFIVAFLATAVLLFNKKQL